jgi:hypothetical protein
MVIIQVIKRHSSPQVKNTTLYKYKGCRFQLTTIIMQVKTMKSNKIAGNYLTVLAYVHSFFARTDCLPSLNIQNYLIKCMYSQILSTVSVISSLSSNLHLLKTQRRDSVVGYIIRYKGGPHNIIIRLQNVYFPASLSVFQQTPCPVRLNIFIKRQILNNFELSLGCFALYEVRLYNFSL